MTEKRLKNDTEVKGTAMYIAPELLKNEVHDNRVDLYSLGIILYKIIYDRFPFDSDDELEIYKSHVESEFEFPSSDNFSSDIINVIKKLLSKNPDERYSNSLQVLSELNIEIDESVTKDLLPVKVFSNRTDIINIISGYINDKTSSEIFTLKGYEGAGKSTVINHLYESYKNSIRLINLKDFSGVALIKHIIHKIIFSEKIFTALSEQEINEINNILAGSDSTVLNNLAFIFAIVSEKTEIILLIDDYNLLDDFASEILRRVIPILQKNNAKIILAESADHYYHSRDLNNVRELLLSSFTDDEVQEFITLSYKAGFKKEKLCNLITHYSDLLPGSIITFIKDLILLNIMRFGFNEADFIDDQDKLEQIMNSQDLIYDLRMQKISSSENEIIKIISAFKAGIDIATLTNLVDQSVDEINKSIENLQVHNVLQKSTTSSTLMISSDAFKQYIYSLIDDKVSLHLKIATTIEQEKERF
ncbi:MAG: protein kinase, partial [Nitrososphaeraceae archaeon]|nr:protein kinase [Nitrososphaeraceae archaeon]